MSGNNRMASGATGHKCSMLDSLLATLGCLSVLAVGVAGCGSLSAPARYDRAQATAVPQRPAPTSGTSSRVPFLADTPWIGELYQRSDRARVTAESRFIEVDPGDEFLVIERGEGSADIGEYGVETSTNAIASDPADRTSHKEGEPYLFPPKTRWAEITTRQPAAGRAEVTRRKTSALAVRDIPGGGGLLARRAGADKDVSVPLQHTDVKARVSAYVGAVEVTQQFANPFDEAIEAVYVFPLPTDAAVHDFILTIGERRIRGIVRERA
ncbi:MAG: hypothetical protein HZA54_02800, partial [Planctomycetes bacterium]|nr:hypothetical protein [Planctomycetota bacterium]